MDGYQRRTLGKKLQIIQAAVDRLAEAPDQITIAQLAGQANVSPVSIYNYFGSKEALLKLSLLTFTKQQLKQAGEIVRGDQPVADKIQQFYSWQAESTALVHPQLTATLIGEDPEFAQRLSQLQSDGTSSLLRELIRQARAGKMVRADLDDEQLLFYLQTLSYTLTRADLAATLGDPDAPTEALQRVEALIGIYLYGCFKPSAKGSSR